jgi:signal transduction histidine kinase
VLLSIVGFSAWKARSQGFALRLALPLLIVALSATPQVAPKKNVLIINETGLSHSLTTMMTQQILDGVQDTPDLHVEFYSESLDVFSSPEQPSAAEIKDWLVKKYGDYNLDVVVAVGPDAIDFLSKNAQAMFPDVPIVICGSSIQQVSDPRLDSRFTGTWMNYEPAKTIELAMRLFPKTHHIVLVGGGSAYDKSEMSLTKANLASLPSKLDLIYMTNFEMNQLLERLRHLPEDSIVLYVSFFEDIAGHRFVNATKALPMVAEAANAPVFGVSDAYLGHGIVGGRVMRFQEQGKITAHLVTELLTGKKPEDLPIAMNPNFDMFDWNLLERWHVPKRDLPPGSIIAFREQTFWERTRWAWAVSLVIILGLSVLAAYLQKSRKQLQTARESQRQLGGMLIKAQEQERTRLASELHDDFSQRIALLALEMENVAEAIQTSAKEASERLRALSGSVSEIGADLHTLSHRLHSSTLESLGLVPGISALCREFSSQAGIATNFSSEGFPRTVPPDVALCLFRIVQEALRNVQKHSGATEAQVSLRMAGNRVVLSVLDKGRGFKVAERRDRNGLGIRSMEERMRLIGGHLEIHSEPDNGASVEASVVLETEGAAKA